MTNLDETIVNIETRDEKKIRKIKTNMSNAINIEAKRMRRILEKGEIKIRKAGGSSDDVEAALIETLYL